MSLKEPRSRLGLVCITRGKEIRYRTITRSRFRALSRGFRQRWMRALYTHNLDVFYRALQYCAEHGISRYRVTSDLFPMSDYALGQKLIAELAPAMAALGTCANRMVCGSSFIRTNMLSSARSPIRSSPTASGFWNIMPAYSTCSDFRARRGRR